jgi:glyoxylate reductase
MTLKVFVTRTIPPNGLAALHEGVARLGGVVDIWSEDRPITRDELLQRVRGIDGLYCLLTEKIDDELLDAAGPQLKVISQMGVGYDNVDVTAVTTRRVPVGNTPGVLTDTTADMAFALLMAAARRLGEAERFVRDHRWQTWSPKLLLGADVHGATLGIVGFGRIGQAVAKRAKGFNMRVLYVNRSRHPEEEAALGVEYADFETLLRESDFVSLNCALTPETRGLMGEAQFKLMKPSAILINTARGPVVDQAALYRALAVGVIAYAALDVTDPEPIATNDPLLTLENIIIVPHIASATVATREKMAAIAVANLLAGLQGHPLPHCINPSVYPVG